MRPEADEPSYISTPVLPVLPVIVQPSKIVGLDAMYTVVWLPELFPLISTPVSVTLTALDPLALNGTPVFPVIEPPVIVKSTPLWSDTHTTDTGLYAGPESVLWPEISVFVSVAEPPHWSTPYNLTYVKPVGLSKVLS